MFVVRMLKTTSDALALIMITWRPTRRWLKKHQPHYLLFRCIEKN